MGGWVGMESSIKHIERIGRTQALLFSSLCQQSKHIQDALLHLTNQLDVISKAFVCKRGTLERGVKKMFQFQGGRLFERGRYSQRMYIKLFAL